MDSQSAAADMGKAQAAGTGVESALWHKSYGMSFEAGKCPPSRRRKRRKRCYLQGAMLCQRGVKPGDEAGEAALGGEFGRVYVF